jgi:hypothetical protein
MAFFVVAAATIAVSTVYTATQQRKAAKEQSKEIMRQREQEKLQAKVEELDRFTELGRAIAANQLALSESGISGETPKSIALSSAKNVSSSEAAEGLTTRLKAATRTRQARETRRAGNAQAIGTLLAGAGDAASVYANRPT